jgi:hypothetical protein
MHGLSLIDLTAVENGDWFEENWLIWPVDEIVSRNRWMRSTYSDRDLGRYAFFASPGVDGIMYGCPCLKTPTPEPVVFAWYPDTTPDKHLIDTLEGFVRGAIDGGITV